MEVTIRGVLEGCGWSIDGDLLGSMVLLQATLDAYGLQVIPSLGEGGLDTERVVSLISQPEAIKLAMAEIESGEGAAIEFKSTFFLDCKTWEAAPNPVLRDCRSDKVTKAALKTISAYMNTDGGTLLVGIADNGSWYGLENDMLLANERKADFDAWELEVRKQVEKVFLDQAVNSYVKIEKIEANGSVAARIQVARKNRLTFLRVSEANDELYIRSGNRSIPISLRDVENHFEMRRRYA